MKVHFLLVKEVIIGFCLKKKDLESYAMRRFPNNKYTIETVSMKEKEFDHLIDTHSEDMSEIIRSKEYGIAISMDELISIDGEANATIRMLLHEMAESKAVIDIGVRVNTGEWKEMLIDKITHISDQELSLNTMEEDGVILEEFVKISIEGI